MVANQDFQSIKGSAVHLGSVNEQERILGDAGQYRTHNYNDCLRKVKAEMSQRLKKLMILAIFFMMVAVTYLVATRYRSHVISIVRFISTDDCKEKAAKFQTQRNEISRQLNLMKQAYGQQNCELLTAMQESGQWVDTRVSENGGWCKNSSRFDSSQHLWDSHFSAGLSKFLEGKSVASFGEGPGKYKTHMDSLGEVKLYDAYDGAPYCENVTEGLVKFLDMTAPQYGLPAYDWVVSVEVGEHIPAKFEDVYLDNLARHAREGIILSWAVPGQDGLSHVNNRPLDHVIDQMTTRGFHIDMEAGEPLRMAARYFWLRANTQVYKRTDPKSFHEEDT